MKIDLQQVIEFTDITEHVDFYNADYYVFGLYPIKEDGTCACEYPDCKNVGKHPTRSGWQHPIKWDQEQFYNTNYAGQYRTGYGVLMKGLMVVDVDAKNGGVASFEKLMKDLPQLAECGLMVETGSGGGSKHLYFKYDGSKALRQSHQDYPGIDFKSTGYVVGPGSLHRSGRRYKTICGSIAEITEAPVELLELLEKTSTYRLDDDDRVIDITEEELKDMINHISTELHYEDWISVGMAINDALDGDGFELWNDLSKKVTREDVEYDEATTWMKWKSFKPGGGVGYATLKWHALKGGWTEPVTFTVPTKASSITEDADDGVDLHRPPGFVGAVCDWINDQCAKPRENLSAIAALVAVGNLAGSKYKDSLPRPSTSNLFAICAAGSGSGKNSIVQAINDIHDEAGLLGVTYGKSKSSAEIYRNLISIPTSLYNIDELGIKLSSIANAGKSGASYFETWFGEMMTMYSNANGKVVLSGDELRDIQKTLLAKISDVQRKIDDNEMDSVEGEMRISNLQNRLERPALINPFVSLIGYSTPETLEPIVTPERVREGFLGRTILAWEPVDLPEDKENFSPRRMTDPMKMSLRSIAVGMDASLNPWDENKTPINVSTSPDAMKELQRLTKYFHNLSLEYMEENGMHAVPTRGIELVSKISFILGIPGQQRTLEHVKWATAFVLRDIEQKIRLALGNTKGSDALSNRVLAVLDDEEWMTSGVLNNKCRKFKTEDVSKMVEEMVQSGVIEVEDGKNPTNGKPTIRYKLKN